MKKIITSNVLDPLQLQPFTAQSLRFLQESKEDDVAAIIKSIVISNLGSYSLTIPYVISGCVVTNLGKTVTAGEVFFGGKYYQTTACNFSLYAARYYLTTTQDITADPLIFSNGTPFNVHTIYKYVATEISGGGDFTSFMFVSLYGIPISKITFEDSPLALSTSSLTFVDLNASASYTTPSGSTKTWLITYKTVCKWSAPAGDAEGGSLQIYNATTSTAIDTSYVFLQLAGAVNNTLLTGICHRVISLPPSTIIKARVKSSGGVSVEFSENVFSMIEI